MKLKEFINNPDLGDIDVYSDYSDVFCDRCGREREAGICFVQGNRLTAEGEKEFSNIMDLEVELDPDCTATVHIPEGTEEEMDKIQNDVFFFLYAIAGYVSEDDYNKWFIEE